jgi:hypothetical protein
VYFSFICNEITVMKEPEVTEKINCLGDTKTITHEKITVMNN